MSTPQKGDYFSFDEGKAFAMSTEPGWFLIIRPQGRDDDEPTGSYMIETWQKMPSTAKRVNIQTENFGGMGINIALAFQATLSALAPTEHARLYVRPSAQ